MSTTTHTNEPQAPQSGQMSNGRVIAYSLGDVANNTTFLMTSMFFMVYMTEIVGISAAIAGTIYGVTKVWAGIADLIAGQTVDRVDTKWGHLRPWLLWVSGPLAIVFVIMFSVPAGIPMGAAIAWILLFDVLYQLAYSFINIPYGSLSAAMTQNPVDRSRLSGARSIASAVTGVVLAAVIAPQFDDTTADGIRLRFTIICAILAVIAVILYLICFANTRETVARQHGQISFKATFTMLRQNRPLITLCIAAFFLLGAMFTMNAVGMYYAIDVLGNSSYYFYLTLAQTVGTILVSSFVPAITVRLGKRNGYILSVGLAIVGYLIVFFNATGSLWMAILGWFVFGAGTGGSNALMFSMQADTVDYGEWRSNIRAEGGSYSILSFIRKCGQGIGGWLGGFIIAAFGYVQGAASQDAEAIFGIRSATGLAPAILAVIAALIMVVYKLDAEKHAEIVTELNSRRTQEAIAERAGVPDERVRAENVGDGRDTLLRAVDKPNQPIVTVFGQRGSGASDIGPMVAERLKVKYFDQAFSSATLAQADRDEIITDSGFSRWMRRVALGGSSDADLSAASTLSANGKLAQQNTAQVLDDVSDGGVMLGRNGALILARAVGAMHVRLIAPQDKRIERVMHQMNISAEEAWEQCETEDRLRAEMSLALYNWNPNNSTDYDLVINTGSMTYEAVADVIAETYLRKYPTSGLDIEQFSTKK